MYLISMYQMLHYNNNKKILGQKNIKPLLCCLTVLNTIEK